MRVIIDSGIKETEQEKGGLSILLGIVWILQRFFV